MNEQAPKPELPSNLDAMLQAANFHQLQAELSENTTPLDPNAEGVQNDSLDEAQQEKLAVFNAALSEIYVPEAGAQIARMAERQTAEEGGSLLKKANYYVQGFEEDIVPVKRALQHIDEELPTLKTAVREIQEMIEAGRYDSDRLQYLSARAGSFDEMYQTVSRGLGQNYEQAEESMLQSSRLSDQATGTAELTRSKVTQDKKKLEAEPEKTLELEGLDEHIEARGAQTVEEHSESCDKQISGSMERIADFRDDCHQLTSELRKIGGSLNGKLAAESLPRSQRVSEAVERLRSVVRRSFDGQPDRHLFQDAIDNLYPLLSQLENGTEDVRRGQDRDKKAVDDVQDQIMRILGSDLMQAA
jgi:hypothetical protein